MAGEAIIDISIIRGRKNNDTRSPEIFSNPLLMPRNYPHTRLQLSIPLLRYSASRDGRVATGGERGERERRKKEKEIFYKNKREYI